MKGDKKIFTVEEILIEYDHGQILPIFDKYKTNVIFVLIRDFLETAEGKICGISIIIIFIIWYFYEENESE